jgi:hypothetical protein
MRTFSLLFAVVALVSFAAPWPTSALPEPPVLVIAHKAVASAALTRDDLRSIFQTKKSTWPDGVPVRPFNLPGTTLARQSFDLAVLGLEPARVARYWIDRQVRGGERPPPTVPSAALMIRLIAKTAGAVGYIDGPAAHPGVKVVARVVGGQVLKP